MKAITTTKLSDTLTISEFRDGFWLYDATRGMNLAWAKTKDDAFVEALTYYQKRLKEVEQDHANLASKVNAFIGQFHDEENDSD
jgi:hypothetical protein